MRRWSTSPNFSKTTGPHFWHVYSFLACFSNSSGRTHSMQTSYSERPPGISDFRSSSLYAIASCDRLQTLHAYSFTALLEDVAGYYAKERTLFCIATYKSRNEANAPLNDLKGKGSDKAIQWKHTLPCIAT